MHLKSEKRTALVDVELILYAHAAKAESSGTGIRSLIEMCDRSIRLVVKTTQASKYYLCESGRNNFRKTLVPDYKANRGPKPEMYQDLRDAIHNLHIHQWAKHDQLEADDLLGIMATNGIHPNPIICSIDKDLLGISGWHYNWNKDCWPHHVTESEANYMWLLQLLKGDPTDNIKGMAGVGDVKAKALIEKYYGDCELENSQLIPESAKSIYEREGFMLDDYYKSLHLISIWRKPMPPALLECELINEITKTIETL